MIVRVQNAEAELAEQFPGFRWAEGTDGHLISEGPTDEHRPVVAELDDLEGDGLVRFRVWDWHDDHVLDEPIWSGKDAERAFLVATGEEVEE